MILRPYQLDAREKIKESSGNICVVLPGGSGKSICIADFVMQNADKKILMLTHVKELIRQNEEKLLTLWPDAPVCIYSAGLKRKELDKNIIFAGIQSIGKKFELLSDVDYIVVDECDLINHKEEGLYRQLIGNINARVIGFTATPYRMNHGLIIDKPAIFDSLIYPEGGSILELTNAGYLSRLISKATPTKLNVNGVHKRGGEYIESELQKAVDKNDLNDNIVEQVIERSMGRYHWLFFCAGIDHAEHMAESLRAHGIAAESVSSIDSPAERDIKIADFKSDKLTALTNNNILTTGFDFPNIDLIAHCRPTMSPRLYEQMNFRGTRLKSHIDNCLCLDFAGVIAQHGAMTDVRTPQKHTQGEGIAPCKECPKCFEIIPIQLKICYSCNYEFPKKEKKDIYLRNDDIMSGVLEMAVDNIKIREHIGYKSGKRMIRVTYCPVFGTGIDEYLCVYHPGVVGIIARKKYNEIKNKKLLSIQYIKDGKFFKIINKTFDKLPDIVNMGSRG